MTTSPIRAAAEPPIGTPDIMIVETAARARSETNSAISAFADGISPPRPSPASSRSVPNCSGDVATAHSAVNTENQATQPRMVRRRPSRSARLPAASAPTSMPTNARLPIVPAVAGVRLQPGSASCRGSVVP
jgi:hypothetical protein